VPDLLMTREQSSSSVHLLFCTENTEPRKLITDQKKKRNNNNKNEKVIKCYLKYTEKKRIE
jgi:hypothetical protein